MKLYVVTEDGYKRAYGSEIYLIGVFDKRPKIDDPNVKITEVKLNKEYPLHPSKYFWSNNNLENDKYLGGYYE